MASTPQRGDRDLALAGQIRDACIREALRAYEDAGISGLCHEGRFEAAISALRVLDLRALCREGLEHVR
jgi:hypothetical protein